MTMLIVIVAGSAALGVVAQALTNFLYPMPSDAESAALDAEIAELERTKRALS